jgi:PBSX family phage terminase large subunit
MTTNNLDRLADLVVSDLRAVALGAFYPAQRAFIEDTHTFSAFVGGIGSGKTISGCEKARREAMAFRNVGFITAPTFGILRDATIPAFKDIAGHQIAKMTNAPPIDATMVNGSIVKFRSAHKPDLLRGSSIAWWFGDEAALVSPLVWRVMIGRLREGVKVNGRKSLGRAWLATTPQGRNWVYKTYVTDASDRHALFKAKTSENPFLDPEYYLMLASSYEGDFRAQELDAEWISHEGLIYNTFSRERHVTSITPPTHFKAVIAGVDWGYANPGCISVWGIDYDGRMWGLHEEYQRRRRVEEWVTVAQQIMTTYGVESFWCDPSEPDFIAMFQAGGIPAYPANNEVLTGIQAVYNRLAVQGDGAPRLILSSEMVHTAAEFEQYIWFSHSIDGVRDQPRKANDHALDSLRYATLAAEVYDAAYIGDMRQADEYTIGAGDF